jgi:hypothetical protein
LENVDTFYGHLEYFKDISGILWPVCVDLVHFSGFGIMHQEKSGNPVHIINYFDRKPTTEFKNLVILCRFRHLGKNPKTFLLLLQGSIFWIFNKRKNRIYNCQFDSNAG